jgi:Zn-dependent peptidase ImmA (M78 family)
MYQIDYHGLAPQGGSTMTVDSKSIELIAAHLRQMAGADSIPTDVTKIVQYMGGEIKDNPEPWDIEAKVEKNGNSFQILLTNYTTSWLRKKFSIAHELGHIILHSDFLNPVAWQGTGDGPLFYRCGTGKIEYEANDFAAALLMPQDIFKNEAAQCLSEGYYDIETLARKFAVSIEAAKVRGKWLGLFSW